ncbi:hypothetical protein DERF_010666 [Dermatophagoides farinae]|uniref:Uncharacterized protein n=1 Tax=Dermatophagoides farinae TaxID=6954 RepID=A0A922L414_DERFA|nr:hypothetical protein DERF_010666 [Dermatophagoides farinae]
MIAIATAAAAAATDDDDDEDDGPGKPLRKRSKKKRFVRLQFIRFLSMFISVANLTFFKVFQKFHIDSNLKSQKKKLVK